MFVILSNHERQATQRKHSVYLRLTQLKIKRNYSVTNVLYVHTYICIYKYGRKQINHINIWSLDSNCTLF